MGVLSLTVIALNNNMCFIFLLLLAAQMEIKRACVPKTHLYTQLNTIPIETRPITLLQVKEALLPSCVNEFTIWARQAGDRGCRASCKLIHGKYVHL